MRDDKIYRMRDQEAKRLAMIYRQVQFIQARIEAYEIVSARAWDVLRGIFQRGWFTRRVDAEQLRILSEHDQKIRASMEEAKKEQAKPKLTIVGSNGLAKALAALLFVSFSFTGCVSIKTHKRELAASYKSGYAHADAECIEIQKKLSVYIESMRERLKKFNQIDSKGNLYPSKPFWKGTPDNDDKPGEGS